MTEITKEKTAKFFPNAIAVHLKESRHVFGSFLSREQAYLLMSATQKKVNFTDELMSKDMDVESTKTVEISETATNDIDMSSLEESSSISGSEGPIQLAIAIATNEEEAKAAKEEVERSLNRMSSDIQSVNSLQPPPLTPPVEEHYESAPSMQPQQQKQQLEPTARIGNYSVTLMNEFNILYFGICLAILLAIFSGVLFFKINAIEKRQTVFSNPLTFDEAESILQRNLALVKTVRSRLEELHHILDDSIKSMPKLRNEL